LHKNIKIPEKLNASGTGIKSILDRDKERHDFLRGEGSYEKIVKGIKTLIKHH